MKHILVNHHPALLGHMVIEGLFLKDHNAKEWRSLGGLGKRKYAAIAALNPDVPFEQAQ